MRYLLLSSCISILLGCTSAYKHLQQIEKDGSCLPKFKPQFTTNIYTTQVNIVGNYLSGLLFIKTMPDSSTRLVFSSEMGLSFFDFEFSQEGNFKVHHVISKMNRKAVLKTLKQDFELILMQQLKKGSPQVYQTGDKIYYAFSTKKGSNYYITDLNCERILGIEKASKRKAIVKAVVTGYKDGVPDSINISHTNFQFTISLKRLNR
jgi:hypothetical protein